MGGTFVYAFVQSKPLDDVLRGRAGKTIRTDVVYIDHTVRLDPFQFASWTMG